MKINLKKYVSLLLAAAVLMSLAACGDKPAAEPQISQMEAPAAADAEGMAYLAEYKTISEGTEQGIYSALYLDDGLITSRSVKTGTRELYEGEVYEYEGQLDIWESRLYFCSYDGTERELPYRPVEPEERIEGHQYSSWVQGVYKAKDGLLVSEDLYENWSEAPAGTQMYSDEWYNYQKSNEQYIIRYLDMEGNEQSRFSIPVGSMENGEYFYIYSTCVAPDGNVLLAGDGGIKVYAPEGTELFTIECTNWVDRLITLPDGRIFASYYGDTGMTVSEVDMQNHSFGEPIALPNDCYNCISGGGDYDFYYTSGSNLYGFSLEAGKAEKIFNWINIDVNGNDVSEIHVNPDGSFTGILNTWNKDYTSCKTELVTVSKHPASEIPEKIHLTLACQYLDWEIQNRIIEYNRGNARYHIDVLDYSEYNTEDDYSAGMTKLTTELLSGSMPDILYLSGMPVDKLADKGLLEDLYTWIDNDPDMARADFFPSVLKATEVDGKLYSTVAGFSVCAVTGAASVVGDEPGWTFDEFKAAYAQMPEDCTVFNQNTTQSDMMYSYLPAILPDFVNTKEGKCNFESDEFINFLNFVKLFPKEFDWEKYDWTEYEDDYVRIMSGRQMLSIQYLYSFNDIQYIDYQFGGKATFVGYPTEGGSGNLFQIEDGYGISSGCKDKQAAWDFLRAFFLPDYQASRYYFPVNITAFDKMAEIAMTPQYQKDADGNYLLDENGEKIKMSNGGIGYGDGEVYEYYEVTAEQVDRIRNLIETTSRVMSYETDEIQSIIAEEAEAFFQGQKSAQEVARLIQSKVNIFINEQR